MDIKCCPFCGEKPIISLELTIAFPTEEHMWVQHHQSNCFLSGIVCILSKWNRRVYEQSKA